MVDFFYWLFDIGYKHSSGTLPADSGTGPSWPCSSTQGRKRRKRRTEVARPGLLDGAGRFGAQRAGPSSGRLRPPLLTTGGPHRDLAGGWAQPAKHRESPRLVPSSPTAEPLPVPRKGRLLHADPDLSGPHGVHGKVPGQRAAAKRLRFSQGCTAAPALSRVCVAAPVLSRERVAAPALGWECVAAPALSREGAAAPGLSRACLAASVLDWEWEAATALSRECVTAPALSREGAAAPVPSGECGRGEVWVSAGERTRRGGCTHQESQGARDREWPPDAEWTAADAKGVLRGGLRFASPERTGHPCFASPFQKGRHGPSFATFQKGWLGDTVRNSKRTRCRFGAAPSFRGRLRRLHWLALREVSARVHGLATAADPGSRADTAGRTGPSDLFRVRRPRQGQLRSCSSQVARTSPRAAALPARHQSRRAAAQRE